MKALYIVLLLLLFFPLFSQEKPKKNETKVEKPKVEDGKENKAEVEKPKVEDEKENKTEAEKPKQEDRKENKTEVEKPKVEDGKKTETEKPKKNSEYLKENDAILEEYQKNPDYRKTVVEREKEAKDRFFTLGGSIGSPAGFNLNGMYFFDNFVIRASGMYYKKYWNGFQGDLGYIFHRTNAVGYSIKQGFSLVGGSYRMDPLKSKIGIADAPFDRKLLELAYSGPSNLEHRNYFNRYAGIAYDLYLGGVFLQLGVGFGDAKYKTPKNCFNQTYCVNYLSPNTSDWTIFKISDPTIKNPHLLFQIGYVFELR